MKILKSEILEAISEKRKDRLLLNSLPSDLDERLLRVVKWREKYKHLMPILDSEQYNSYLDALELENYEYCSQFKVI